MKVLLIGPVDGFEAKDGGYGNSSKGFAYILTRMKQLGIIEDVTIYNTLALDNKNFDNTVKYDVGLIFINPSSLVGTRDKQVINYLTKNCKRKFLNILWETLPLPKFWNELWITPDIDGFLTSSYFVGNQLKQLTSKPVFYSPIYVPPTIYTPVNINLKESEKVFTVLFVGQNTKRKGVEDTIISYCRAFDSVSDTQLIMKCYDLSKNELSVEALIQRASVCNMSCKNSPIYLLQENLTTFDMVKLYQSVSVLLFLSRGEGWGLPVHESMLCGIPSIYTNWSCLREIANSGINYPIDSMLDEAYSMYHHGYEINTFYAVPNIYETVKALQVMYSAWKKDKKEYYTITSKNRDYVLNNFSEDKIIKYFENFVFEREDFCPKDLYRQDLMDTCKKEWDNIQSKLKR